jgi:hypothetical protein
MGKSNTLEEVEQVLTVLPDIIAKLRVNVPPGALKEEKAWHTQKKLWIIS